MLTNTLTTVALVALSTVGMAAAMPPSQPDETTRSGTAASPEPSGPRAAVLPASTPPTSSTPGMMVASPKAADIDSLLPLLTSSVDDLVAELRQADAAAGLVVDPTLERRAIVETAEAVEAAELDVYIGDDGEHIDAPRLRVWLEDRDSPMAEHAEALVAAGIEHDVDPRLVVAIATKESSAGIHLPPGSHNAWGWGGSGAHGLAAWPSWPHAIDYYTERLGALYDTDSVDAEMAERYCPPNSRAWLETVRWVIQDI